MIESHINKPQAKVLKTRKKCGKCGKIHTKITHYTVQSGLIWFDCECLSTLNLWEKKS